MGVLNGYGFNFLSQTKDELMGRAFSWRVAIPKVSSPICIISMILNVHQHNWNINNFQTFGGISIFTIQNHCSIAVVLLLLFYHTMKSCLYFILIKTI